ncbi:hypothetical protein RAS2_02040 [Phycisphaerae bacterium RAS2]|nr:hypothetical protein RAS2_02040 [Phycisphaerae bacterium RAS2]
MKTNINILAAVVTSLLGVCGVVRAQDGEDGEIQEEQRKLIRSLGGEKLKEAEDIVKTTKAMGWDRQQQVMEQATDEMFRQNGWNSEPDQFARNLLRDVGQIPPWQARERQEIFLNGLQGRLSLTHDQRILLNNEMQRETMAMMGRHFKDIVPVVLEVAKTRASDQPFTPEQVQRWSTSLEPIMGDSLETVKKLTQRLERTMTEEQRRILKQDMDALLKRHRDVEKMVVKWKRGEWSPADWGLQNDPIHAGVMQEIAQRGGANASTDQNWKDPSFANNESEWERYVRWFCDYFECDASQRTKSNAILKTAKQEAIRYRESRRDVIAQYETRIAAEKNPAAKSTLTAELNKNLAPIGDMFQRMKDRLASDVLTSAQRTRLPQTATASGAEKTGD